MPKSIIIKSNTTPFIKRLVDELCKYPNIRFLYRKINGEETVVIKCYNYYNVFAKENKKNFYGNYIYLYTALSLILTDMIIEECEENIVKRILNYNYFYFKKYSLAKIKNISNLVLTPNAVIENSAELLLYRKQIILSLLLKNFRKTNYLHIDSFINFSLNNYHEFLEEILDIIVGLFLTNSASIEYLNFAIRNIFEDVWLTFYLYY